MLTITKQWKQYISQRQGNSVFLYYQSLTPPRVLTDTCLQHWPGDWPPIPIMLSHWHNCNPRKWSNISLLLVLSPLQQLTILLESLSYFKQPLLCHSTLSKTSLPFSLRKNVYESPLTSYSFICYKLEERKTGNLVSTATPRPFSGFNTAYSRWTKAAQCHC